MLFYLDIFGCFMCFLEDRISMTLNVTDFQVQLSVWRGGSEGEGEGQEF